MRIARGLPLIMLLAVLTTGCVGDVAQQVMDDPKLGAQVMDSIAARKDMAMGMVDRLMSTDSLKVAAIDHMLQDDVTSKHLLDRVATNPRAMEYVLGVAVQNPESREHILALVKGMEMATRPPAAK